MTTSGFLDFVEATSFTPPYTPTAGRLLMWSYNNQWYATNSSGATTALSGVTSVNAGDSSVVVSTTSGVVTIETNTIDVIATDHPAAANWSNNGFKITNIANGTASTDVAAFGQIPTTLPPNGSAGGGLAGTYPNPTVATNANLTGPVTSVGNATSVTANAITNSMLATVAADTVKGSIAGGTPTDLSQTQLTSLVNPATASLSGALTAAQYTKLTNLVTGLNGWIDVTQQTANPVLTSNTAATNNTNLAAIMSAAASGSTLYFPGGFYPFSSVIAVPGKVFVFQGSVAGVNGNLTGFEWTSNVGSDLITLTPANYGTQFRDILFTTSVAQTAGSVINTGDNANINFYRCVFSGLSTSATLFNGINYTGTHAGEISIVQDCQFTNFTGTGIIGGSNLSTCVVSQSTMNGGSVAACGINIQLGGAFQISNCDIIGCTNDLLINPTTGNVVASVWAVDTYFDNATGSCIKITGAGATVRTKFTNCSFTVSASSSTANAVEVSSTYAYGSNGMGLDFNNCNVLNTFGTSGVGIGFNITGAADFSIEDCNIAGWATGIAITPANANGMTKPLINGNRIGAAGGYAGNTTGVLFNAGSFTYGSNLFVGNDLTGNTTPLTDNSTYTNNSGRLFANNVGLLSVPANSGPQTVLPATTVTRLGSGVSVPANILRVGTTIRIISYLTNTATANTLTPSLRYGTNNSNADTAIVNSGALALAAGTAAVGGGRVVAEFTVLSTTTAVASITVYNNAAAAGVSTTGLTALAVQTFTATAAVTISSTAANFLGLYMSASAASVVTPQATLYEISSQ